MQRHSETPDTVAQQVDKFIDEINQRTGVGTDFLNVIRPAVHRMFQTADLSSLQTAKEAFMRKAELHVQTLAHLSSTLRHLNRLSEQQKSNPALTPAMRRQLEFTRGVVVNTLLKTYGGFGTRVTIFC